MKTSASLSNPSTVSILFYTSASVSNIPRLPAVDQTDATPSSTHSFPYTPADNIPNVGQPHTIGQDYSYHSDHTDSASASSGTSLSKEPFTSRLAKRSMSFSMSSYYQHSFRFPDLLQRGLPAKEVGCRSVRTRDPPTPIFRLVQHGASCLLLISSPDKPCCLGHTRSQTKPPLIGLRRPTQPFFRRPLPPPLRAAGNALPLSAPTAQSPSQVRIV